MPTTELLYDPLVASYRANPYPMYARFRSEAPIVYSTSGLQVVSRFADVSKVLRSPEVSRDIDESATDFTDAERVDREFRRRNRAAKSMLNLDAPDHTRLRGLVTKAFTPRAIAQLRPRLQQLVDDALDPVVDSGRIELNQAMAFPLPFQVISDLLAMPTERADELRDWSQAITLALEPAATAAELAEAGEAVQHVIGFLVPIIEDRRKNLGDDVLSALIAVEEAGERLSLPELISTVVLLYIAGHETTVNLIGNGALALAQNPSQRELWRATGEHLDSNAVDEMLRYDGPMQQTIRVPLVDMEVSGGVLPAGRRVLTLLGAANRDGDVFEAPDELRLDRPGAARHMAFASGVHYCLGASLARLEAQVALGTMVRRFEHWDVIGTPEWRDRITIRGVGHLDLALS